jgi:Ser/Thr protein kinase RdoA (MazF antagonist)
MKHPEAKVHGLDGHLVTPDWPLLRLQEVDQLLRRFPQAEKAARILSYSPRPFSAASVVETLHGKVFVKRHHRSVRDKESLVEEHRWLAYLSKRTPLVKAPLPNHSGETVVTLDDWTYEVHPHGDGLDVYEQAQSWTPFLSVSHARSAGKALAQLHAASVGYDGPARKTAALVTSFQIFASDDPWPRLIQYIKARPELHEYLSKHDWLPEAQETFQPLSDKLRPYLQVFQPLWTHNDFHASNLLWSDTSPQAEVTDIFDVGLADRTNAIHDIATAIERNGVEWLQIHDASRNPLHLGQIEALLNGYEELRPLSREESEALVALLPLVHAEFALSEADYFCRVLKSPEKTDLAYSGYFLGHARWFRTDHGKQLLSHLQSWTESHPRKSSHVSPLVAPVGRGQDVPS